MGAILAAFERQLGFVPGAIAVLGKWEPHMRAACCLRELSTRAAAAVALAEALGKGRQPYLLCAEGQLRGQPKPGCLIAADLLVGLGADARRIRCWPASNHTVRELEFLGRMCRQLDAGGLLVVTSNYHVPRTRCILGRTARAERVAVASATGPLVEQALGSLPDERRRRLADAVSAGSRRGLALLPVALSEGMAFLSGAIPGLDPRLADLLRGRVDPQRQGMFAPQP